MNKTILVFVFTWGLGLTAIYLSIDVAFNPNEFVERGFILEEYSNIFIKYGISFMMGFAGLGFLIMPILAWKNILPIGTDYYYGNKYTKAKSDFIIFSLFLPTALFFTTSIYFSELQVKRPIIVYSFAAFLAYKYFHSIFIFIKSCKKPKPET